jgi:hypothetical protein
VARPEGQHYLFGSIFILIWKLSLFARLKIRMHLHHFALFNVGFSLKNIRLNPETSLYFSSSIWRKLWIRSVLLDISSRLCCNISCIFLHNIRLHFYHLRKSLYCRNDFERFDSRSNTRNICRFNKL